MNRINPLYLLAFFFLLCIGSLYSLTHAKDARESARKSYEETYSLAHDLQGLRNVYDQKEQQQKSLSLLLDHPSLRSANFTKEQKNTLWHVRSTRLDKKQLDMFLGKILNAGYPLKGFSIERLDNENATIDMEIQW